jgi:hypothetical protein
LTTTLTENFITGVFRSTVTESDLASGSDNEVD